MGRMGSWVGNNLGSWAGDLGSWLWRGMLVDFRGACSSALHVVGGWVSG